MSTIAHRPHNSTTPEGQTATGRHAAVPGSAPTHGEVPNRPLRYALAATRMALGWIFLWAFLDKTFALGFATGRDGETGQVDAFGPAAWINGGSPTKGFLTFGTSGPFAELYQGFAGAAWANWLFMLGLLGIGAALLLGVAMRIATACGILLMALMWAAALPPANNPITDDHVVYALTLLVLLLAGAGRTLGLGRWWEGLPLVQKYAILR